MSTIPVRTDLPPGSYQIRFVRQQPVSKFYEFTVTEGAYAGFAVFIPAWALPNELHRKDGLEIGAQGSGSHSFIVRN